MTTTSPVNFDLLGGRLPVIPTPERGICSSAVPWCFAALLCFWTEKSCTPAPGYTATGCRGSPRRWRWPSSGHRWSSPWCPRRRGAADGHRGYRCHRYAPCRTGRSPSSRVRWILDIRVLPSASGCRTSSTPSPCRSRCSLRTEERKKDESYLLHSDESYCDVQSNLSRYADDALLCTQHRPTPIYGRIQVDKGLI